MNEKVVNLMSINADNLKEKQFNVLKEHGISLLRNIIGLINENKFEEIERYTFYSPAGDGMGSDNNCINFDYTDDQDGMDISSYVDLLISLKPKKS